MGIQNKERIAWDKYDLLSAEGIAIEVKTSGYLQTWEQKGLSKLIFGIQPTLAWDSKTNEYDTLKKRQADIYVFCVHKHKGATNGQSFGLETVGFLSFTCKGFK